MYGGSSASSCDKEEDDDYMTEVYDALLCIVENWFN